MDEGLSLVPLSQWLETLVASWCDWGDRQDAAWLALRTGNQRHPVVGQLFAHAFTPLHHYADQAIRAELADNSRLDFTHWPPLKVWAHTCQSRHAAVVAGLSSGEAARVAEFRTRSAGVLRVSVEGALFHAGTHCFWHLGGIAHLLRREGIAPPPRSDFIFWASAAPD